jgi:NIMA (never in mitosis gene a)-related kinase
MKEAALLNVLRHPSIISYYEAFIESDVLHIVMEYAERGDLQRAIRAQKKKGKHFVEKQVLLWTCQLAMAVDHMHAKKVLHRDLKTANVFLLRSGVAKIGDFGIAKVLEKTCGQAETQIGTPYFLSPEAVSAQPYGSASDIWGLGCVIYEVCALQRVFNASSLLALVYKIVNEPVPKIPAVYSKELQDLVASMLCKEAADRPSAADILATPLMQATLRSLAGDDDDDEEADSDGGEAEDTVPAADAAPPNAATPAASAASTSATTTAETQAQAQGGSGGKENSLRSGTKLVAAEADPSQAMAEAEAEDQDDDEYDDDFEDYESDTEGGAAGSAAAPSRREPPSMPLETPRPPAPREALQGMGAASELKSPGARATRQRELVRRDDAIGSQLRALAAAELDRPSPGEEGERVGFAVHPSVPGSESGRAGGAGGASDVHSPPGPGLAREVSSGAASMTSVDSYASASHRHGAPADADADATATASRPTLDDQSSQHESGAGLGAQSPAVDRPIQAAQSLQDRVRRQRFDLLEELGGAVFDALYAKLQPVAEGRIRPTKAWQAEAIACVPGDSVREKRAVVMNMEALLYDESRARQVEEQSAAAAAAAAAATAASVGRKSPPGRSRVQPLRKGGGRTMLGSNAAVRSKAGVAPSPVVAGAHSTPAHSTPAHSTPAHSRLVRGSAHSAAAARMEDEYEVDDDEFETPPSAALNQPLAARSCSDTGMSGATRVMQSGWHGSVVEASAPGEEAAEEDVLGSTGVMLEAHSEPASARGPRSSVTMASLGSAESTPAASWHVSGSGRLPSGSRRRPSTSGERTGADRPGSASAGARPGSASRKRVHVVRGALPAAGSARARPQSRDAGSAASRRNRRGSVEFTMGRGTDTDHAQPPSARY